MMLLAAAAFDPQLIKGDICQYCKGLVASIENHPALVGHSFQSALPGDENPTHCTLQPGNLVSWERHLQKGSLQPHTVEEVNVT